MRQPHPQTCAPHKVAERHDAQKQPNPGRGSRHADPLCRDACKADSDTVLQTIKFASGSPISFRRCLADGNRGRREVARAKCGHLTGWPPRQSARFPMECAGREHGSEGMAVTSVERSARGRAKTDPAADYLGAVRDIAPALAAAGEEIDPRRALPEAIGEGLIERGLFRLLLPHALDGAELVPAQYVPIIEEIAKIDASTAWCLNQNSGCSMTAALLAPEVAREIFGGPHGILAWGPGPGEARVVVGGYRVTASWSFASGSQHASWLGCHVPVIETDGRPRLRPDGSPVVRTMLFPKSSTKFTDIWHSIGLRGTASNQYSVEDLFVPEAYSVDVLSRRPTGTKDGTTREEGLLYRFSSLSLYAAGFARVALGIGRAMLGHFIELARDKIPRGARNTMRNNNVIQSQVARAEATLSS